MSLVAVNCFKLLQIHWLLDTCDVYGHTLCDLPWSREKKNLRKKHSERASEQARERERERERKRER
jgi:hypothetical protein